MKYIKQFEGYFNDELKKLKSDYESGSDNLVKQFQEEAKQIFNIFTDEVNVECDSDFSDPAKFYATLFIRELYIDTYLDKIIKLIKEADQVAKAKGLQINYMFAINALIFSQRDVNNIDLDLKKIKSDILKVSNRYMSNGTKDNSNKPQFRVTISIRDPF